MNTTSKIASLSIAIAAISLGGCGTDSSDVPVFPNSPVVDLKFNVNNNSNTDVTFKLICPNCELKQWAFNGYAASNCDSTTTTTKNSLGFSVSNNATPPSCEYHATTASTASFPTDGDHSLTLEMDANRNYTCDKPTQTISVSLKDGQTTNVHFEPVTCTAVNNTVQLKATNTAEETKVTLSPLSTSQAHAKQSSLQIALMPQNNFNRSINVGRTQYAVSVTPKVNSADLVAVYPEQLSAKDRSLSVRYQATSKKLIAIMSSSQLGNHDIKTSPYNTIEITDLVSHAHWNTANESKVIAAQLPKSIRLLATVSQRDLQSIATTINAHRSVIDGLSVQVDHITPALIQELKNIHAIDPTLILALSINGAISSDEVKLINDLMQRGLQPFPGWVQVDATHLASIDTASSRQYWVANALPLSGKKLKTFLADYPQQAISGLVLSNLQLQQLYPQTSSDLQTSSQYRQPSYSQLRDLVFLSNRAK